MADKNPLGDPFLKWVRQPWRESCPSCLAAEGQVHKKSYWYAMGIYPGSRKLVCCKEKNNCNCHFEEVDGIKKGSITIIPIVLVPRKDDMDEEEKQEAKEQNSEPEEIQVRLSASGQVNPAGRFEVDVITVGVGNGFQFSEEVLRESLSLWDGATCFVDHGSWFGGRSVKDIAGVFSNPRWCEDSKGIRMDLSAIGPAGKLVEELGRQILAEEIKPRVGFSADVVFTAKGREVQKIMRVLEVCLVYNPARGGAFVRAMNSIHGGFEMSDKPNNGSHAEHGNQSTGSGNQSTGSGSQGGTLTEQLQKDAEAVRQLLAVQEERSQLAQEAEAARAVRLQMCAHLLDSGLGAAKLPAAMSEHLRTQFAGKLFEPAELTDAIDQARKLVSDLTGSATVAGPGRIHSMFNSDDQLQAAVDDLLEAPREPGAQGLKAARLGGIKELYMMMTGDRDLYGGFYADRVQLATTANFTGLVKNAMNKIVAQQWAALGAAGYDWWERITTVEHFNTLNQITGVLVGTVGALPEVAEGAEYTELKIGDSPETADFVKYGGYIPLTLELIDRDNTRKLRLYPRELAKAGLRRISALVAAVFTANAGIGPTMADTGALFNNTAVTTAGGHANLLVTALSATQWEVVSAAVYNQPLLIANEAGYYGTGAKMAINPRYLVVPRALKLTAEQILYPAWDRTAQVYSENLQQGQKGDVVVVPEWTDATDWAAVVDPALMSGIVIGERFGLMPEIFIAGDETSPAVFMNDEHRIKVRHFVAVLVQDFRALHKSNV
jgi:hypothetical protein